MSRETTRLDKKHHRSSLAIVRRRTTTARRRDAYKPRTPSPNGGSDGRHKDMEASTDISTERRRLPITAALILTTARVKLRPSWVVGSIPCGRTRTLDGFYQKSDQEGAIAGISSWSTYSQTAPAAGVRIPALLAKDMIILHTCRGTCTQSIFHRAR